jgi:hypothetical protein
VSTAIVGAGGAIVEWGHGHVVLSRLGGVGKPKCVVASSSSSRVDVKSIKVAWCTDFLTTVK